MLRNFDLSFYSCHRPLRLPPSQLTRLCHALLCMHPCVLSMRNMCPAACHYLDCCVPVDPWQLYTIAFLIVVFVVILVVNLLI
jgi:hypothetical protein